MFTKLSKTVLALALAATLVACNSSEERAEESYQSARALYEDGDSDRAMVELRNALELDENHSESRALMAQILLEDDRIREAYGQYLRIAEQNPEDLESRVILARIAFGIRNWDEFDRHASAAAELAADDPRVVILTLARDYRLAVVDEEETLREGLGAEAAELLVTAPDSDVLRNIVIDDLSRAGDYAGALAELDILIQDNPQERSFYNQRIALLAQTGDEVAIEAALREVIDLFPDDNSARSNLLRYYLSRQDTDGAESFLREFADPAAEDTTPFLDLIRFVAEVRGAEAARAEIERAIAENPNPAPFQALKASLDFAEGQRDEAIATLEGLLETAEPSEETDRIKITLARFYLLTGNNVGSRNLVSEILENSPSFAEALKMQAAWQIEADNTDDAIAGLRLALDSQPEDVDAMQLMAQAYRRAGNPDLARDFLSLAVEASGNAPEQSIQYARVLMDEERYLPAEDVLIPSLRLYPDNPELLQALGALYLMMEDVPRTDQVIATLRRIDTEQTRTIADDLEIRRLAQTDGTDEALAFIENLADQNGDDLGAQLRLIQGRLATGDSGAALSLLDELIAENPDEPQLALARAATLAVTGDTQAAADGYTSFLADNPDASRVWLELSRLRLRENNPDAADAVIEEGLAANPGDPELLWAKASVLEGDGDIEGAIAIYEELYAQSSNWVVVANNLASLLSTYREDPESLERAYTIARRFSDADNPALQDTYGWIVFRRGDAQDALPYLEAAAEGLPQDAMVQTHLARALISIGETDRAIAQLQRALEVAGPADTRPQIEAARAELARLQSEDPVED